MAESVVACNVLNQMTELGRPESYSIGRCLASGLGSLTVSFESCTSACAGKARSRGTRCRDVIFETLFETLWVSQSHPAKVGRQPEPSDAWAWGDPGREAFTGSP